ncbi:MAG: cell division protein FtsZ [Treponema sp.]|jgi:cell division protein FtsZ|nr:cell division protein FtsZ [Treponema sp.]
MIYQVLDETEVLKEEVQKTVNIIVVGSGGGGCKAVDSMIKGGIKGVKFVAVNTDIDALRKNYAETKIQIGINTTGGRGAGGMPDRGEQAAIEDEEKIRETLKGAHMVFVVAGMGGGTGTGSAPVIARIARSLGALTVGVVTKPFAFELNQRKKQAEEGIIKLKEEVDTLIVIPNEKILDVIERKTSFKDAFARANDVLSQGVKGISDLIVEVGEINLDFADAEAVMKDQGEALMSIGYGEGENRVAAAASNALDNPLLEEISIKGATNVLVYVSSGDDFSMHEFKETISLITADVSPDAHVFAGMYINPELKDSIKVVVIATGFTGIQEEDRELVQEMAKPGDENFTSAEFKQILEKSKKSRNDFLSRRDNGYMEEELEIPSVLRYQYYNNSDDCVSNYATAGKSADK